MVKVGLVSLGCAKNLVDSEMALGLLQKQEEIEISNDPKQSDLIIVNTCGFIQSAKEEAIRTIFDMAQYTKDGTKKLVVMGCLSQRYKDQLVKEMPEVDRFISIDEYDRFGEIINEVMGTTLCDDKALGCMTRLVSTPSHWAYVRIADGCDNCCTYCAIPLIRGNYVTRTIHSVKEEVSQHLLQGKKEIVLIAQDTTRFGQGSSETLEQLLRVLAPLPGLTMLRVLYLYPNEVTESLIQAFVDYPNIAPYFDIPIQHASDAVLKRMNRRDRQGSLRTLIQMIRTKLPQAILRTTVMVGFPGETQADFDSLKAFLQEIKFDRLGAFMYSPEENTLSATFVDDVPQKVKEQRYHDIMRIQQKIAHEKSRSFVGTIQNVLIETYDQSMKRYCARNYAYAGDQADGWIYVTSEKPLILGGEYQVKIVGCYIYDLIGEICE